MVVVHPHAQRNAAASVTDLEVHALADVIALFRFGSVSLCLPVEQRTVLLRQTAALVAAMDKVASRAS